MARIVLTQPSVKPVVNTNAKTRKVPTWYYQDRIARGCPHCNSELNHQVKTNGEEGEAKRYYGVFARCYNDSCPATLVGTYYYISPTVERIVNL